MRPQRIALFSLLTALGCLLLAPPALAACEVCKGHFTNRSCRSVAADESGYSGCKNDFFGNCINGTIGCTGTSCGKEICEENKDTRLDPIAPGGEVLLGPIPVCELPGFLIEA
jgi:hypothetical protein